MAITVQQARSLRYGERLHDNGRACDSKNGPYIWRVNGRIKTWVRSPERFRVPIKHGLYSSSSITENDNLDALHLERECHVLAIREAIAHGHPDWSHLMAFGPCTIFSIYTPTVEDYTQEGRLQRRA